MSDSFTETSTRSWTSRIGASIKGVLTGICLVGGSCALLFWNEGRAVQTQRSLTEGASLVASVDAARVDPANDGKLIHVNGDIKPGAPLSDPDFSVTVTALRLVRTVEMFQWKEEQKSETRRNVGGSEETVTTYEYRQVWEEGRIDSSRFRRPDGHTNPQLRYSSRAFASADAVMGAYRPGVDVINRLPASDAVPLDPALAGTLQRTGKGPVQIADGRIYLGASPSSPKIGDIRVSFKSAPAGPASIIGRQAGTGFAVYQTKAGDALLMVRSGTHSAADMFAAAQRENTIFTWILRLLGVVLMFVGFMLVLNPLVVVADVVPFIGSILSAGAGIVSFILTAIIAPIVVAVAWLWYRPLVSIAVLVVGFGIAYALKRRASAKAAAARNPQSAPA